MNVDSSSPSDNSKNPREIFRQRCEARALLWQTGEFDLHDAVDELEACRKKLQLDVDAAQLIMARAFAAVRCDLGGWRP